MVYLGEKEEDLFKYLVGKPNHYFFILVFLTKINKILRHRPTVKEEKKSYYYTLVTPSGGVDFSGWEAVLWMIYRLPSVFTGTTFSQIFCLNC